MADAKQTITFDAEYSAALRMYEALTAKHRELGKAFREGAGDTKPANEAIGGLTEKFRDFKRDQVQQGRLVGFYTKEIGEFVEMGKGAQQALGGIGGAMVEFATGSGKLGAAFAGLELVKGVIGMIREESRRAAEAMKKFVEEAQKAVDAGTAAALALTKKEKGRSITLGGGDAELSGARAEAVAAVQSLQSFERRLGLSGKRVTDDISKLGLSAEQIKAWAEMTERVEKASSALREYVSIKPQNDATQAGLLGPGTKAGVDAFIRDSADALAEAVRVAKEKRKLIEETARAIGLTDAITYDEFAPGTDLKRPASQVARDAEKHAAEVMKHRPDLAGPMFGPGNDEAATQFALAAEETKKQATLAAELQQAWEGVGSAMSGAFNALGNAIGGAAGKFLSTIGEMISQAIKFAIAMAAASVAQTPVIGGLMAAAAAISLATALVTTIASVPSYDVGTYSVPQTGLALVHKGEAILPTGGPAESFRAGKGATVNVSMNITAMNGSDVYRTLTASRSDLARVLREAMRDGVM